jgi:hypothetical protein
MRWNAEAAGVEASREPAGRRGRPSERFAVADGLAVGAAVLTVVASVAGLVVDGLYRDPVAFVELTRADDVFRLVVVVPVLVIGLAAGARGSMVGSLAACGALATLVYLYGVLAFGAAISALTIVQIAILGLSFWALLLALLGLDPTRVDAALGNCLPRRATAAFLLAMAALSTLQWGATIVGSAASGVAPADVARYGWTTSPLYAIELAFAVPLFAATGLRLLQRHGIGVLLAPPLLVFLALLGLGLAWESAFVALGGGAFDAGMALAGMLFFALPAVLIGVTLLPGQRRQRTG